MIEYGRSSAVAREEYRLDGEFQRLVYYRRGKILLEEFHINEDLPLATLDGMITLTLQTLCDREDGPAYSMHRRDASNLEYSHSEWYQNGEKHRADGPAVIFCSTRNGVAREEVAYWVLGEQLTEEEFRQYSESRGAGFSDAMSKAWAGLE